MTVILRPTPAGIEQVAAAIRAGEVVAIPTDTVYGLAADPFRPAAVSKLLRLKERPEYKPILLLVDSRRQVENLVARLPESFDRIANRFWPGPVTVILPAAPYLSEQITGRNGTVAVRLPGSVLTRRIIAAARRPLTGTSANRSGRPAAQSAVQVRQEFPAGLPFILDGGPAPRSLPSTIVDLTGEPKVIREGAVPAEAVLCLC